MDIIGSRLAGAIIAKDIAAYINESENDEAVDALQAAVTEAY